MQRKRSKFRAVDHSHSDILATVRDGWWWWIVLVELIHPRQMLGKGKPFWPRCKRFLKAAINKQPCNPIKIVISSASGLSTCEIRRRGLTPWPDLSKKKRYWKWYIQLSFISPIETSIRHTKCMFAALCSVYIKCVKIICNVLAIVRICMRYKCVCA